MQNHIWIEVFANAKGNHASDLLYKAWMLYTLEETDKNIIKAFIISRNKASIKAACRNGLECKKITKNDERYDLLKDGSSYTRDFTRLRHRMKNELPDDALAKNTPSL